MHVVTPKQMVAEVERLAGDWQYGRLSYKDGTIEDYIGRRGLKRLSRKTWERLVASMPLRVSAAIHLDDLVMWMEEEQRRSVAAARNAARKSEARKT
jgi:hypothetical protein